MGNESRNSDLHIAIVGMAVRIPGATTPEAFWRNLDGGVESISVFSKEELLASSLEAGLISMPNYVAARAILPDIENFDAGFFGMTPREAALLDPQQRLLLECAQEALDASGCAQDAEARPCGVFAGVGMNGYLLNNLWPNRGLFDSTGGFQVMLGNDKDFCATRISYKLNLRGPSLTVQTACSSSLTAVHLACQSLLQGECDLALAGGSAAFVPQKSGYLHEPGMILSPDGHCRPFDAGAAGTVAGNGAAMVVLKRLGDAIESGDNIKAVILGSAVNNDGAVKIGYTAPSEEGQRAVIAEALAVSGVSPYRIGYIETHGTGTPQGDPIEFSALTQVFGGESRRGKCALGAVKSNLGHLDAAAGVVGLVKAVLALQHGAIPRTLHFERPNPAIDLDNSPFFIPTATMPWDEASGLPRRAGVSSFGIGGTNVHVVLEEAPPCNSSKYSRPQQAFVLSAKSAAALDAAVQDAANSLEAVADDEFADAAYTWNSGRRLFAHRRLCVAANRSEAIRRLRSPPQKGESAVRDNVDRRTAFLFAGQGTQYPGMGRGLYESEPVFRQEIDKCANLLKRELGSDMRDILFRDEAGAIYQTQFAQPCLFAVEYALAQCLIAWGVRPIALLGHSLGEWVAACVGGVMALEEVLPAIVLRGRLMQRQPAGAMLGVHLGETALAPYLGSDLATAAVNAPRLCSVAGPFEAIASLERRLSEDNVGFTRLVTSHAFHSAMMEPVTEPLAEAVASIRLKPPRIRMLSNVTGRWLTAEEATDPRYWARQVRAPVRCAEGLELLFRSPEQVLVEVGPGKMFEKLASQFASRSAAQSIVQMLPGSSLSAEEAGHIVAAVGRLRFNGVRIDWNSFHTGEERRRISLPAYPFQRERCWIDPVAAIDLGETRKAERDWFYLPGWRRSLPPQADTNSCEGVWLVAGAKDERVRQALMKRLSDGGADVIELSAWPESAKDWKHVISERRSVRGIILFQEGRGVDELLSLTALAQALPDRPLTLSLVTRELNVVSGHERPEPLRSLALGALRVLPQEEREKLTCRQIDLGAGAWQQGNIAAERILIESLSSSRDEVVAYRGAARWVPGFERIDSSAAAPQVKIRERGVYLITGGLGGIGLTLAEDLARSCRARVVLVSRSGFAERAAWQRLAADENTRSGRQARCLLAIEAAGGEVVLEKADVADELTMSKVVAHVESSVGPIHGVIHAAGVPGGGVLAAKSEQSIREILRAKVDGADVLDRIFQSRVLDFMVLCSSVTGWLGGFGQADYCAANLYLDAFADSRTRRGRPTFSILWDTWRDVGMAVETEISAELRLVREEELRRHALSPSEGAAAFRQALRLGLPQVVVSTRDFHARYAARHLPLDGKRAEIISPKSVRHPRPLLTEPLAPPRNELERRLSAIWEEHLGFAEIGVNDNYFDLGGDSLKGIALAVSLQRAFGEPVRVATLFEKPTIAELAQRFDQAPTKEGVGAKKIVALPRAGSAEFEVSSGQRRLWFLHKMDSTSTAYHMPAAMRIRGPLDAEALAQCHREIIRRHESLRTVFSTSNEKPMQVVLPDMAFDLPVIDLADVHEEARQTAIDRIVHDCARRPFDLENGPLLRAVLVRFAPLDHLWVLVVHHIVSDAQSMDIIVQETTAFYRAIAERQPTDLPELSLQYADYAAWQSKGQQSEDAEKSLTYWRETLAGAPPLLALPTDRPRPARRSNAGARVQFFLDPALVLQLRALSRETGGTLFTTLLTGFTVLLARLSGEKDFVVGTPTAGRNHPELNPLIGFFINNLVLRADLTGNPTVREHLLRTLRGFLDGLAHQETPFDRLVEALQPPRNLSYTPLFQVMFGFVNSKASMFEVPGLVFEPVDLEHESAAFDLTLLMRETETGLVGDFEYSTDLFDRSTIETLGRRFERVLRSAVENPEQRVAALTILEPDEASTLLDTFNVNRSDIVEATWPALLEAAVSRTPDALALVRGATSLTYRELNERANRLARSLIAQGVGPEDLVGICFERCFDLFTCMLGVMKAGAAYVPLDPNYPPARLAYMIEDAAPALVLCGDGLSSKLPRSARVQLFDPANEFPCGDIVQSERTAPLIAAHPAYVIYTSGSTGLPKGVVVTHAGLASLAAIHIERLQITGASRVLQFASFSFDSSVAEFVMALTCSAALVLAPADERSGEPLRDLIRKERVTIAQLPPAALTTFSPGDDLLLEALIVAGEACPGELVERWSQRVRMFNAYGPTESTVCATLSEPLSGSGPPPIGDPLWNTRIYVLDAAQQLVPPGVCGELYIAGVGLARGYLKRPSLTAERFLPDPYGKPGTRMYATGDLARWRSDGTIDYLGRVDHQVKLRGFRIELGEVEAALAGQPGVAQVAVLLREDGPRGKQLVAYVVSSAGAKLDGATLHGLLRQDLPDHMIPTEWVLLPALPLGPNGKLDRAALPVPKREVMASRAAGTPAEQILCGLFAEVLSLPGVGTNDNFFDLGGDSILSLQIVSRARAAGLQLNSRHLFEHQTIAELARVAGPVSAATGTVEDSGPRPLTPIQHWFFEQDFAEPHHFNQAVMVEVAPGLKNESLQAALQSLVEKHGALRTRFVDAHSFVMPAAEAPAVELLVEEGADIELRAQQLQGSLSLETGVLMRAALFRFGPDKPSRLLWILHHLVVDGVSWRILLQDLDAAIQAIAAGRAPSVGPVTSFGNWAQELGALARNAKFDGEIDYWRRLARKRPPRLPRESEGVGQRGKSSRITVDLEAAETAALLRDASRIFECRHNDLLLTALTRAFTGWTGERQLLIDLESHGRAEFPDVDLSGIVGWFSAVYPVSLSCDERLPLKEQIKGIHKQLAEVPQQGLGHGVLRYLHSNPAVREVIASLPQPDIIFNYFGHFDQALPASQFLLRQAQENAGPMASAQQHRTHLIEVNVWVEQGRLTATWTYDEMNHRRNTVEALANAFARTLRDCASGTRSPVIAPEKSKPSRGGFEGDRLAQLSAALQKADRSRAGTP
jgi:amino acid adenylation domain-containing protein/non-ribosomal peptide synthase protein (TIGR01720 family)